MMLRWDDCNGNNNGNDVKDYGDKDNNDSWSYDHEINDDKGDNDVHDDNNFH